jgi:hypothetical protein
MHSKHLYNFFSYKEDLFFKTLEKFALPIRQSARQMSTFMAELNHPTTSLNALKHAYAQLESIPIKDIYKHLEEVSSNLDKVNCLNTQSPMSTADFISFMRIKNQLCAELNELVVEVMRIKNRKPLMWVKKSDINHDIFTNLTIASIKSLADKASEMCAQQLNRLPVPESDHDQHVEIRTLLDYAQKNTDSAQKNYLPLLNPVKIK